MAKCFDNNCGGYMPVSNADRIRSMSDEELAEYLLNRDLAVEGQLSQVTEFRYTFDRELCLANLTDWLRREVSNE